jgi:hypothetical protein
MFPVNSSENGGNGFGTESVTDFKSYNVDVIALGDLQINDNFGLTYLTGINFLQANTIKEGNLQKLLIDNTAFSYDNALIVDKTTFGQKIF